MPSLIWKEWHEQSWKLGFGCLVLGALSLIGLRSRLVADLRMMETVCFLGIVLLPVLSSTGLVPAERADGTMESLLALPMSPLRILAAKTLMGLLLCSGPLAVAAAISLLVAGGREVGDAQMLFLYMRSICASAALLIWMMAFTIHLPNETRAGLLTMGLLIFWMLGTVGLTYPPIPSWAVAVSPLVFTYGVVTAKDSTPPFVVMVAIQGIIVAVLWYWASWRLARGEAS